MGKRIKKLKRIGGAEIEQANHAQTSLGVRTRAKTLALQHAKMLSLSTASTIIEDGREKGSCLQLRSRRLKRLPLVGAERNGKNRHNLEVVETSFGENELESESKERYNFDPVKDEPLPGRFEWEKVKP
ncbi:hypothetical protein ACH5RR_031763 [Cinchona calisaya]|uniref:Cyclin-dependent kinase inhibitor domain-containing protein n=1 Tax=Cinchona calisaya TaxID=153742 RepID=A0ABD2YI43_9GENT